MTTEPSDSTIVSNTASANPNPSFSPDAVYNIQVELYKQLRTESHMYLSRIPDLWMKKLTLTATMLATPILQDTISTGLLFGVVAVAPIFAALLDAKVLECSLQAHLISRFIEEEYTSISRAAKWERMLWGYSTEKFDSGFKNIPDKKLPSLVARILNPRETGITGDQRMALLRTATTALLMVVPTIIVMCAAAVAGVILSSGTPWAQAAFIIVGIVELLFMAYCLRYFRGIFRDGFESLNQRNEVADVELIT